MSEPLGPTGAARLVGFTGEPHNLRRNMIAYVERRERALGIKLWVRSQNGRREIQEATLRTHCPELFDKSLKQVQASIRLHLERIENTLDTRIDQRIERPLAEARAANRETASSVLRLTEATEKRFELVECRLGDLEGSTQTDANRRKPTGSRYPK